MAVNTGIPGIGEVLPGAHICALYSGPFERDTLLFSFLRAGLREGDSCLCLIEDAEPAAVRDQLEQTQNGHRPRSRQLDIDRASEVYRQSGRFSVEQMFSFVSTHLSRAAESDFPLLRAAGEMSWMLPEPGGAEDFFAYELAVTKIVDNKPAVFLCMYNLEHFGVRMLVDLLRTHPKVLLDHMLLENPHYLTPEEYLEVEPVPAPTEYPLARVPKRRTGETSDTWRTLTDAELRIAELVAGGLTNRNIADYLNLSPHTVDAHLKHTFAKLNIHSRVELTVLALEHR
jgi:DNA-binding CsgD family transcriptional regulator